MLLFILLKYLVWLSPDDQVQDLPGEGDHDASGQREKAVGPLGGIMTLEAHAHLHDTEAQKDKAYCSDEAKDKGGKVIYHAYWVLSRKGRLV